MSRQAELDFIHNEGFAREHHNNALREWKEQKKTSPSIFSNVSEETVEKIEHFAEKIEQFVEEMQEEESKS